MSPSESAPKQTFCDAPPKAIALCFTSGSYVLGPEADEALELRLEKRTGGIPVAIQALEEMLGKPVITSKQVTFWAALWLAGIPARIAGYGRLFDREFA